LVWSLALARDDQRAAFTPGAMLDTSFDSVGKLIAKVN
jgi:hypothetical protein